MELLIAPFIGRFKKNALEKYSWHILSVLETTSFGIAFFLNLAAMYGAL